MILPAADYRELEDKANLQLISELWTSRHCQIHSNGSKLDANEDDGINEMYMAKQVFHDLSEIGALKVSLR